GAGGGSVRFRNFEAANVTSLTGRLELLGDYGRTSAMNPTGSPATDSFAVTATGPGAGRFVVNGTAGLFFTGLTDLYLGTSAGNAVTFRFDPTPGAADVLVAGLFNLDAGNHTALTVNGGDGNDDFTLDLGGAATLPLALTINGDRPAGGFINRLTVVGNAGLGDVFANTI